MEDECESSDQRAADPTVIAHERCTKINALENSGFGRQAVSPHRLPGLGGIRIRWRDPVRSQCVAEKTTTPAS